VLFVFGTGVFFQVVSITNPFPYSSWPRIKKHKKNECTPYNTNIFRSHSFPQLRGRESTIQVRRQNKTRRHRSRPGIAFDPPQQATSPEAQRALPARQQLEHLALHRRPHPQVQRHADHEHPQEAPARVQGRQEADQRVERGSAAGGGRHAPQEARLLLRLGPDRGDRAQPQQVTVPLDAEAAEQSQAGALFLLQQQAAGLLTDAFVLGQRHPGRQSSAEHCRPAEMRN